MIDKEFVIDRLEELSKWLLNKSYSDLSAMDYYESVNDAIYLLKKEMGK